MSKLAADFQKKNKMFIHSLKYPNKENGKILKNEAAELYLEPCQISMSIAAKIQRLKALS